MEINAHPPLLTQGRQGCVRRGRCPHPPAATPQVRRILALPLGELSATPTERVAASEDRGCGGPGFVRFSFPMPQAAWGGTGNPSPTMRKPTGYGIMTWLIFGPVGPEKRSYAIDPHLRSDQVGDDAHIVPPPTLCIGGPSRFHKLLCGKNPLPTKQKAILLQGTAGWS